jgi:ribosomal protein S27AE
MSADPTVQAALEILGGEIIMQKRPCKKCGKDIILAKTQDGKWMPLDADTFQAWYLDENKGETRPFTAHKPHWATCPNADEFRKKKEKENDVDRSASSNT